MSRRGASSMLWALVTVLFAFSLALTLAHAEEVAGGSADASSSNGFRLRNLLVEIPIGQGRCAGTFSREWLPCYISEYSLFASF
eukprot:CAMPEP_0198238324 /NCGR_PEP_ID=MMETSP1446-20131203/3999_1 /TAXON_ID=1461542 ORGANISM="Unidentified sp, Strain CCMP2111" /NCGR_SAMPLE_ID=MMETSP1446 /ASSEMBLY_ACC=CAM_ASM_001112 /LENGTH=83 /DNA_ID=CAMNT_0043920717 /DNA_START=242 /DNA_END=493 /DNA_ORIENTATION=-